MTTQKKNKFTRTATFKGMMIALITLLMLIPAFMVENLILERKYTRDEAIMKIDAKWSYAQIVGGPVLVVPYTTHNSPKSTTKGLYNITPEKLDIDSKLFPEERYYGIYKTILYKSKIEVSGTFPRLDEIDLPHAEMHWNEAYLRFGLSDLRGISEDITVSFDDKNYQAKATGETDKLLHEVLKVKLHNTPSGKELDFSYTLDIKGSGSINFSPIGRTTNVKVTGAWEAPGFIGNYTPDYTLDDGFEANWKILNYNRSIPDTWTGDTPKSDYGITFGVSLIEPVDIYQQNMRSAKYALLFIALTFVIFFFVELINRKCIHPIQYILVGIALILFYSLLLSISEPLGFGWAYLISSLATIGLITGYTSTIFKNSKQTFGLAAILVCLYLFLFIILQLEDMALLAGSIGLFVILGIIMYFSKKINWYSEEN